jgi:hypothetical protein
VLKEPLAHIAGGDAHNGVVTRVIRRRTPKQLDSDDTLFQGLEMAGNCLVDDVLEELAAAVAPLKCGSFDHFLDVLLKQGDVFLGPCDFR